MKKTALFLLSLTAFSLIQLPLQAGYYEDAARDVARQDAIIREARIQERERELRRQDAESIVAIIKGIFYVISSTGKVIFQCKTDDTEKIVGFLGAGALLTATCAGIYHLITGSDTPKTTRTTIIFRR